VDGGCPQRQESSELWSINAAAGHISQQFREMGYTVREQVFVVEAKTVKNLEAELPGKSRPKEIILFGAHYDSVIGSPGANDNATGVAAVLSLARFAKEYRFARTLRFVAFVNEEPPYFQGPGMGSRVYARECAQQGNRIAAMVSLETIGYYSDRGGSQSYPFPFSFFYPKTGNSGPGRQVKSMPLWDCAALLCTKWLA